MNLSARWQHWLFDEFRISVEGLGLYRITYVLYIFFIYGIPDFTWIAEQPQYYYNPRLFSVAALVGDYPGQLFFYGLQALITLGFAMLLVGWHTRKVSIGLSVLVVVAKSFAYGFGHLDHDLFAWITPIIMAPSAWGEAYSVDAWNHRNRPAPRNTGWSLHLLALLLAFAMLSAGMTKLLGGWLSFSNKAVHAHLAYNYYVVGRHDLLATPFMHIRSAVFWEIMDWTAVLFELAFMVAMFRLRWYRMIIGVALVFHGLNMVMLNIPFTENLGAYLAYLPWTVIALKAPSRWPKQLKPVALLPALAFTVLCAIPAWIRQPASRIPWIDGVTLILVGLLGVAVCSYYLFSVFSEVGPRSATRKA